MRRVWDRCCRVKPPPPCCSCACVVYDSNAMWKKKKKKSFHAEHSSAWAHEAVKRDEREKEKLMHGIADPLTKLSLCTHRGAALTTRSVRESGDAAGRRRRARARLTRRTRLSKAGHVRRLFTRSFSLGKTWNGAPAWSQIRCGPPGAQHERAKLNRAACYVAGWSDCAAPAAAVACAVRQVLQDSGCKRYSIRGTFSSFYLGATGITVVLNTSVANK